MREFLADIASIMRFHIILVAIFAEMVMSWLLTGEFRPDIALLGGVDWLLINLLNKLTDLEEDAANDIRGTERVASHKRGLAIIWIAVFTGSFAWSLLAYPELTPWRIAVQLIGLGYSLNMVPTPSGLKRFKDIYFLKNFMSSVLFVHTVFIYPFTVAGYEVTAHPGGLASLILLILFFVPFELTYEILYDMRDLEGDRLAGVPTYPVVHGIPTSRKIIDGLLILAFVIIAAGFLSSVLGLREALLGLAPGIQLAFYRPRYARGLTSRDCIQLTHLGTGLLAFYIVGNLIWLELGLPENIYL